MFDVRYKGLRLIPSRSAMHEMMNLGLAIEDCKEMLEQGHDAPRKRSADCEEKWLDSGKKTFNVVVVKSFNHFYNEEVYLITHLGRFARKEA